MTVSDGWRLDTDAKSTDAVLDAFSNRGSERNDNKPELQKELPGLRGFSATNIKNMRSFYEEWSLFVNRQPMADENKTLTAVSDSELNSLIAVELKSGKFLLHIWDNYHIEVLQ